MVDGVPWGYVRVFKLVRPLEDIIAFLTLDAAQYAACL